MATTISFDDLTNPAINLPVHDYPSQAFVHLDQSIQQAMGGRITNIERGNGTLTRWVLQWQHLSVADFAILKTFFYTTVTGASTTVTYTDEASATHTVKYLGGIERAQLIDYDSYRVDITLAEV
jgi:hypothetical protein